MCLLLHRRSFRTENSNTVYGKPRLKLKIKKLIALNFAGRGRNCCILGFYNSVPADGHPAQHLLNMRQNQNNHNIIV
jgi:hypothetical protein